MFSTKMKKVERGILGVKKDPKNRLLFVVGREGNDWTSDSDDSDYDPSRDEFGRSSDVVRPLNGKRIQTKKRKRVQKPASDSDDDETEPTKVNKAKRSNRPCITGDKNSDKVVRAGQHASSKSFDLAAVAFSPSDGGHRDLWGCYLPESTLFQIFKEVVASVGPLPFLTRAARVSVLWNRVAGYSLLWTQVDLSYGWIARKRATLVTLCGTRFSQLREIDLTGWTTCNDEALRLLTDSCPRLDSLNLAGCGITGAGLTYLSDHCQLLSSIHLSSIAKTMGYESVKYLLRKRGASLKCITLQDKQIRFGTELFKLIAELCLHLEVLCVSCEERSAQVNVIDLKKFQLGCPKLRTLQLVSFSFTVKRASQAKQESVPGFPCLEELNLSASSSLSVPYFVSDAQNRLLYWLLCQSVGLRTLDLRRCSGISCGSLRILHIPGVQRLYLAASSSVDRDSLAPVIDKWKESLVELDLSLNAYPESCLDEALRHLGSVPTRSHLEQLDLRGTRVSPKGVMEVLDGCPRLTALRLDGCRNMPRGTKKDYSSKDLKQLKRDIFGPLTI